MTPPPTHSLLSLPEFRELPEDLKFRPEVVRLALALSSATVKFDIALGGLLLIENAPRKMTTDELIEIAEETLSQLS